MKELSTTMSGCPKDNCHVRRRNGQGVGLRNLSSVRGAVVYVVVFRAHEVKSNIWKHREVPRSCGHGDCGSDLHPFWRFAHTTNVYVDNVGCGFVEIGM